MDSEKDKKKDKKDKEKKKEIKRKVIKVTMLEALKKKKIQIKLKL